MFESTRNKNSKESDSIKHKIVTVWFNAWGYNDSKQIWAGLASEVISAVERELGKYRRILLRIRYAFKEKRRDLYLNISIGLLSLFLAYTCAMLVGQFKFNDQAISNDLLWQLLLYISPGAVVFLYLTYRISRVAMPLSSKVLEYINMPKYKEQKGYQHKVIEDIKFVHDELMQRSKRRGEACKVVIFIDDLDRCSEEKIMEVLWAINLVLAGQNCFFIFLGIDTEMIIRAVKSYYSEQLKYGDLPDDFPLSYLRKIIQLSFRMPETGKDDRFNYILSMFSDQTRKNWRGEELTDTKEEDSDGIESTGEDFHYDLDTIGEANDREDYDLTKLKGIEDSVEELEVFNNYKEFLEDNPRGLKKLINVHRLVKVMVSLNRSALWAVERQRKLVKWVIFCARWPKYVNEITSSAEEQELEKIEKEQRNFIELLVSKNIPQEELALMESFATTGDDILLDTDIDEEFRSAAKISLLVHEPEQYISDVEKEEAEKKKSGVSSQAS